MKIFMNVSNCFIITVGAEGVFDDGLEGFFLGFCCQRKNTAKELVHKAGTQILRIFCVIEDIVDVRTSVIESREEKTDFRQFYDPIPDAVMETVRFSLIGKTGLGQFYRTDGA